MKLLISTLVFILMCLIVVACAGASPTSPTSPVATNPMATNTNATNNVVSNTPARPFGFPAQAIGVWTNRDTNYEGVPGRLCDWTVTITDTNLCYLRFGGSNGVVNYPGEMWTFSPLSNVGTNANTSTPTGYATVSASSTNYTNGPATYYMWVFSNFVGNQLKLFMSPATNASQAWARGQDYLAGNDFSSTSILLNLK